MLPGDLSGNGRLFPTRVLLVASDAVQPGSAQEISGEHGTSQFFVEKAVDVRAALDTLRHATFDVILLDEGLSCREIAASFDALWRAASGPAVMVTSCPLAPDPGSRRLQVGKHLYFLKGDVDEALVVGAIIYSQSRLQVHDELQHLRDDLQRSNRELESTHLQLIQAEKLEALGQLAAGIAHEVKNPLTRILLGVDYLADCDLSHDSHLSEILDEIRTSARRANDLIRGMVDFASASRLSPEASNLNEIIRQAALMIRHELTRHSIDLHYDLSSPLPPVRIDRPKIEQVFVNLLLNAIQAMEDSPGHELRVSTCTESFEASPQGRRRQTPPNFPAGSAAVVTRLDDEGDGIAPEALKHLFEPFFTTKPQGKGTGLGLTVCRKIIDLHGGYLTLANRPQGGTRVTIYLPACQRHIPAEAANI